MAINSDDARRVAALAKLGLTDDEIVRLTADLSKILSSFELLGEVDGEEVAPRLRTNVDHTPEREDRPVGSLPEGKGVAGAPDHENGLFRVPKVLG